MIPVRCTTNLDLWNEKWPTHLPAVPVAGQFIQSAQIWDNNFQLTLEVYSVTYKKWYGGEYIAEIELHIPRSRDWSIMDFYNWYAPKVGRNVSAFI